METLDFETRAGPISFVGQLHTDAPRPSLLAIGGAFPPKDNLHWLIDRFGGANVLVTQATDLPARPVAALTRALEEVLGVLLPDLPLVVLGASAGALFALGIRSRHLCRRVVVEPFLSTGGIWPFIQDSQQRMAEFPDPVLKQFLWELFGIGPMALEPRDYRNVLDSVCEPTEVFVGAEPLAPERALPQWPSFTSEADRAQLRGHPHIRLHEGPPGSGHAYGSVGAGVEEVARAIHQALREAAQRCPPAPAPA